jgi:hypothetical protein
MTATITLKTRPAHKRRLVRAAKRAGQSLSAFLLEAATERAAQPPRRTARPDYDQMAREAHGGRYLALRLVDALGR